jgi:hypothetical protein
MRDLIWTIIVIWLVWKIYSIFKNNMSKSANSNNYQANHNNTTINSKDKFEDAEYVDYEEVK